MLLYNARHLGETGRPVDANVSTRYSQGEPSLARSNSQPIQIRVSLRYIAAEERL